MGRTKLVALTGLFLGLAGFLLGVGFLFLVNVPVEGMLARREVSQSVINIAMIGIIVLWALAAGGITWLFFHQVLMRERPQPLMTYILGILLAAAVAVLYLLLTTGSPVIERLQGIVSEPGERFTFGPYPDEARLRELKAEGYDGVITLLSPMIPFEKILLDQELAYGKEIGLTIHSLPMLPWVSENQGAINQAKELAELGHSRYYIHCYLGKHRADLIKRVLLAGGAETTEVTEVIYQSKLERGKLYFYQESRIIMGPYPTEEEWFHLIQRGQIQEVVSYLDPEDAEDVPWITREQKACQEMGLKYTLLPVRKVDNQYQGLAELAGYIASTKNKVYVHGFIIDEKNQLLDGFLRGGDIGYMGKPFPAHLQRGEVFLVSFNLFLGPRPGTGENELLQAAGITHIEELRFDETMSPAGVASYIQDFPASKGVYFFYGFPSQDYCGAVASVLRSRYYGINLASIPPLIGGHKVEIITERLLVGAQPAPAELHTLAERGIRTIIQVKKPKDASDDDLDAAKHAVEAEGLRFVVINPTEGYQTRIAKEVQRDDNPCYVMVAPAIQYEVALELRASKL